MKNKFSSEKWETKPLVEVAKLQRGFDLPVQDRAIGTVPIFAANGSIGVHSTAMCKGPGVVTGRSGTIGKVHYVFNDYWPLNTSLFVADFFGNHPKWVYYMLSNFGLAKFAQGAGVPTLNRNLVHSELVRVPPFEEQQRIAAILDKAENLCRKRQEAICLTDEFLRAVFIDMFGDPVANPKGWQVKRLADLGSLDRGISKHRPRNDPTLLGGSHPLIQTGEVASCDGYIRSYTSTYSDKGLLQSKLWPAGTLCITIAANIAKTGILLFPACFPDSVVGFTASTPATVEYVRFWLSFLQKTLEANAPESAQKNINLAILRDLQIPVPSIDLVLRFAAVVAATESIRVAQRRSLLESQALLASLQHELLA